MTNVEEAGDTNEETEEGSLVLENKMLEYFISVQPVPGKAPVYRKAVTTEKAVHPPQVTSGDGRRWLRR